MTRTFGVSTVAVALAVGAGCTEEVKRFDVNLRVTRAPAVGDGALQYSYVDNLGLGDGSGVDQVQGLRVGIDATTVRFTVQTVGGTPPGLGRSPHVPIVDGETLNVHVLLAPMDAVGLISEAPDDLGDGACAAADGDGNLFLVGGSGANESGYAFDTSLALLSFGPGALKGVSGVGCAAFQGAVAAVGGCGNGIDVVQLIQTDGTLITFDNASLDELCGAFAAPAADGGVWVVDGDGTISLLSASDEVVFVDELGAPADAVEVTAAGNLVVLVNGTARNVSPNGFVGQSPAVALGRRGHDVLILDGRDVKLVTEAASTERVRGGIAVDADRFVLLSDDTFVGLRGSTVTVVTVDGKTSTLSSATSSPLRAHTAIGVLPGDTVLLAGAEGDGFDGFALAAE
jgi:hypothetical protein